MSNTPYLLPRVREGLRMGHGELRRLDDQRRPVVRRSSSATWATRARSSPSTTTSTREAQDEYAARATADRRRATEAGLFRDEILPISIPQKKGAPVVIDRDEPIRADTTAAALAN